MGPSGSGKTTLLNAIAGARSAGLAVRGTVRLGDADAGRLPRGTLGYAPQDDVLQSTFTPYEAVSFAAAAALPSRASAAVRKSLVQAAVHAMNLHSVAFTRAIGSRDGGGAGLSGGERKRVAVACVLVACPSAALLDEPTSGLDAHSAEGLVRMLQAVAAAGTTILFSVHQPSSQVFLSLDHLTLLSHGERLFSGRVAAVAPHLTRCGLPACPPDTSLADHLLYLTCTAHAALAPLASPPGDRPSPADPWAPLAPFPPGNRVGSGALRQVRLQAWRTSVHVARHPTLLRTQLGVSVGMGMLLGAAFFGVKADAAGFQNKASEGGVSSVGGAFLGEGVGYLDIVWRGICGQRAAGGQAGSPSRNGGARMGGWRDLGACTPPSHSTTNARTRAHSHNDPLPPSPSRPAASIPFSPSSPLAACPRSAPSPASGVCFGGSGTLVLWTLGRTSWCVRRSSWRCCACFRRSCWARLSTS
jgi:ABC-type cobalamin/Fe3+-siderophores transport system ATPase subunit